MIGMRSLDAVTSSWAVIWKQPSPSTAHTMRSGRPDLGTDGGRHAEAHGAETPGVDPGVGMVEPPVLAGPHLVLADARHEDGVVRRGVPQHFEHVLRLERVAVLGRVVVQRELLLPARDPAPPGARGRPAASRRLSRSLHGGDQLLDDDPAVADDRHVGPADLAQLGRVDVDVDDLGVGREGRHLAGHPVVEAAAEGDQQVGLLHGRDRGVVAVHPGHPEAQRMAVGKGAAGHEGGDHVDARQLGQLPQRLGRPGLQDPSPGVDDRAAALGDEAGRLPHHAGVAPGVGLVAGKGERHVAVARPVPVHGRLQHVLRHVEQHRSRPSGRGDVKGLADEQRDVVRVHDQLVVLGHRTGDADGVALLEGVGADLGP